MTHPTDAGHRDYLASRTERVLAANPNLPESARRRIEGKPRAVGPLAADPQTATFRASAPVIAPPIYFPMPPVEEEPMPGRVTVNDIIVACARRWEVQRGTIFSESRAACYAKPRIAVYRLIRDFIFLSPALTGRLIGNRDRATITSGLRRADLFLETDPDWRARYTAAHDDLTKLTS